MVQHKTSFAIVSDFNSPEETESIVKKTLLHSMDIRAYILSDSRARAVSKRDIAPIAERRGNFTRLRIGEVKNFRAHTFDQIVKDHVIVIPKHLRSLRRRAISAAERADTNAVVRISSGL